MYSIGIPLKNTLSTTNTDNTCSLKNANYKRLNIFSRAYSDYDTGRGSAMSDAYRYNAGYESYLDGGSTRPPSEFGVRTLNVESISNRYES